MHLNRQAGSLHTPSGADDPLAELDRQQHALHAEAEQLQPTPQQQRDESDEKEHSSSSTVLPAVIWHDRQTRPQIKGAASAATDAASAGPAALTNQLAANNALLSSPPTAYQPAAMSAGELSTPLLGPMPAGASGHESARSAAFRNPSGDVVIGIGGEGSVPATPHSAASAAPPPHRAGRSPSTGDARTSQSAAAAGPSGSRRSSRVSAAGRASRSSRRHSRDNDGDGGGGEKDWLTALRQKERGMQREDEARQREEQKQEDDEADVEEAEEAEEAEDEEDEDEDEAQRSDDSSSSSSSDEDNSADEGAGDEEEGEAAGGAASQTMPPTRRSNAADDALRITIIGELVSKQSKQRQFATSPPLPIQHTADEQKQAVQQQTLSKSTPAATIRPALPLASSQPISQAATAASSPGSAGTTTPPSAPAATATISPPFPAPAIARPAPLLSSSASASSSPPVSSLPSPARLLTSVAGGDLVGSCRVFHGVEALVRSRYDSNYDRPDQPVWISIENADNATVEVIGRHFDLHPLTVEDVQSKHTREKLEIFQHYLFLVFHSLQHADGSARERRRRRAALKKRRRRRRRQLLQRRAEKAEAGKSSEGEAQGEGEWSDDDDAELQTEAESESMRTVGIKLIVFPHLVLSFTSGLRFPTLLAVRHRLRRVYDNRLESTAWIIHAMLDSIVDALLPVVDGTVVEVDALEDLIYVLSGSEHRDLLKRMGLTRRRLSFLRQRLWSKRDILMSLIGKDWQLFLAGVQIPYLRDVYDHVVTMLVRQHCGKHASTPRWHPPTFAHSAVRSLHALCSTICRLRTAQGGGCVRAAGVVAEHLPGQRVDRRGGAVQAVERDYEEPLRRRHHRAAAVARGRHYGYERGGAVAARRHQRPRHAGAIHYHLRRHGGRHHRHDHLLQVEEPCVREHTRGRETRKLCGG